MEILLTLLLLYLKFITFALCVIDLTDYKFPTKVSSDKLIRVAIMASNDLHGGIFPNVFSDSLKQKFSNGGGTYLYSYAKILKEDWGEQFLWFDAGDQLQGTMECMLSDGNIMKDYYNKVGLHGITIGNHEYDYGIEYLKEFIKKEKFPFLAANIYDKNANKYIYEEGMWENVQAYQIYTIKTNPEIKIGIIGLATKLTPSTTSEDVSNFTFTDYYEETKKWTDHLREQKKVDSVILLTHFGPSCNDNEEKMKLKMRDSSTFQGECEKKEEIMDFLQKIKTEGLKIDAVIGGHVHNIAHHWISDIPVVESSGPDYFNVIYLAFKNNTNGTVTLQDEEVQIEGPIPICEKIWPDTKNCDYRYSDSSLMENFIFHNKKLTLDEELTKELAFWEEIINTKLKNELVETLVDMSLNDTNEALLSNFINDLGKIITDSDICFYNLGGMRTTWHKGFINEIDVFKMFPFNNTWVRFEMTGEEVEHMFRILERYLSYPQSGLLFTVTYSNSKYNLEEIINWNGINEIPLEHNKTYKICTNDYLADGGSAMGDVREWYKELRNKKDFGKIRELIGSYLKLMKIKIDDKYFLDENHKKITVLN